MDFVRTGRSDRGRGRSERPARRALVPLDRIEDRIAINNIMVLGENLRSAVIDASANGNILDPVTIQGLITQSSTAMNLLLLGLNSRNGLPTPRSMMGDLLINLGNNVQFPSNMKEKFDHIISLRNACEHFFTVGTILTISKLNTDWNEHLIPSVVSPPPSSIPLPPPAAISVPSPIFKVKGSRTLAIPPTVHSYALTNTNSVTVHNDSIRGYVFKFSGNNFLSLNVPTPIICTKTFWVSTSTPASGNGNVFSSVAYPVWFEGGNYLKLRHGCSLISTQPQTSTWMFYAVTITSTSISLYTNGTANGTAVVTGWSGDTNAIVFGAYQNGNNYTGYLDDMRLYPVVLSPVQIQAIYNGA